MKRSGRSLGGNSAEMIPADYRLFALREADGIVALACGRERTSALRFYEDPMGYERPGYSMRELPDKCPISAGKLFVGVRQFVL